MNKFTDLNVKINVDDEQLQDAADTLEAIVNDRPNITIRNNDTVNVTINYFNATAKEDEA